MNSSYELVSLYMDVCWCSVCPRVLERSDGMCHQREIDGGGCTKGPFFSKKNCVHWELFSFGFFSLHSCPWQDWWMNECWKHLRLECANLTKSWCDLLLQGNAEESVSNSVLTQLNQPSQPNQLCMRVSLKHSWAGLLFFFNTIPFWVFQNFQNQGTPHFQVFKKKKNIQKQK